MYKYIDGASRKMVYCEANQGWCEPETKLFLKITPRVAIMKKVIMDALFTLRILSELVVVY